MSAVFRGACCYGAMALLAAIACFLGGPLTSVLLFGICCWGVFRWPALYAGRRGSSAIGVFLCICLGLVLLAVNHRVFQDQYGAWLANVRGQDAFRDGDYATAAKSFGKAAERWPGSPKYVYNLGVASHKAGQYEQARDAYQLCAQMDPTSTEALYNLAAVSEILGATDKQLAALVHLLSVDANHADGAFALARLLVRLEAYEEALPLLARASRLYPEGSHDRQLTMALLASVRALVSSEHDVAADF